MISEDCHQIKSEIDQRKVILVAGRFDPLHLGHVNFLECAKALGGVLVVALVDDEEILKIGARHFLNETSRAVVVSALRCVDHVLLIGPHKKIINRMTAISSLMPYIFATGSGYERPGIREICEEIGCQYRRSLGGEKVGIYIPRGS